MIERIGRYVEFARRTWAHVRGRLLTKYVVLLAGLVSAVLVANGLVWIIFSYQDQKTALVRIQREQAEAAAAKIGQFVKEIEAQLGWMTQLPWSAVTSEQRRFDALRLLRQAPAITELSALDEAGREQLRVSRMELDVVGGGLDRSNEPVFTETRARKIFYGPVYLHRDSEPYMTLALSGQRGDAGVIVARVNLKLIWDVVSRIKVGDKGEAYVVDASGRLIAHPDISLVLRNTDFSGLAQVRAALTGAKPSHGAVSDAFGRMVLAAHAAIAPLGWWVFVEVPAAEAFAPLYATLMATGVVLIGGLLLAVLASLFLARKLVMPVRMLETGAARIGAGALDHRIEIATGDELQALGDQFNSMAARLQESYASLERKVEQRTQQLRLANLAKSRFLAAASHDLRQPLHALNLFADQLRAGAHEAEQGRLVGQIRSAVAAMNELFNALLDISKLDAGGVTPKLADFPIGPVLERIGATFIGPAREKGLRLRVVPNENWVRSDPVLLERILLNLVSNAVKYTERGGVLVGCRRRGDGLSIEVVDTGIGIPEDQKQAIFAEFTQLAGTKAAGTPGLGLGLAIVDRLCQLLGHPLAMSSRVGKGSWFVLSVPVAAPRTMVPAPAEVRKAADPAFGKLVLVIDNDPLVQDAVRGLLTSWGCEVIAAGSADKALAHLPTFSHSPDLIISDYHLSGQGNGFEAIAHLHKCLGSSIPAFLISGDTSPERRREASERGYQLLHKPVLPMTLRAVMAELLKEGMAQDAATLEPSTCSAQPQATSTFAHQLPGPPQSGSTP